MALPPPSGAVPVQDDTRGLRRRPHDLRGGGLGRARGVGVGVIDRGGGGLAGVHE